MTHWFNRYLKQGKYLRWPTDATGTWNRIMDKKYWQWATDLTSVWNRINHSVTYWISRYLILQHLKQNEKYSQWPTDSTGVGNRTNHLATYWCSRYLKYNHGWEVLTVNYRFNRCQKQDKSLSDLLIQWVSGAGWEVFTVTYQSSRCWKQDKPFSDLQIQQVFRYFYRRRSIHSEQLNLQGSEKG